MSLEQLIKDEKKFKLFALKLIERQPEEGLYLVIHNNSLVEDPELEARRDDFKKVRIAGGGPAFYYTRGVTDYLDLISDPFSSGNYFRLIAEKQGSMVSDTSVANKKNSDTVILSRRSLLESPADKAEDNNEIYSVIESEYKKLISGYISALKSPVPPDSYFILACSKSNPKARYPNVPVGNKGDFMINIFDSKYGKIAPQREEFEKKKASLEKEGYAAVLFVYDGKDFKKV